MELLWGVGPGLARLQLRCQPRLTWGRQPSGINPPGSVEEATTANELCESAVALVPSLAGIAVICRPQRVWRVGLFRQVRGGLAISEQALQGRRKPKLKSHEEEPKKNSHFSCTGRLIDADKGSHVVLPLSGSYLKLRLSTGY